MLLDHGRDALDRRDRRLMVLREIEADAVAGVRAEFGSGRDRYAFKELLTPLHATATYIGAKALEPFVFYGAEYNPTREDVDASVKKYLRYLADLENSAVPEFSA